jgi:hypothetical protein
VYYEPEFAVYDSGVKPIVEPVLLTTVQNPVIGKPVNTADLTDSVAFVEPAL